MEEVKVIKVKGESFSFDIKELDVNKYLAIEQKKVLLSNNTYQTLNGSNLVGALHAANIISMVATFRTWKPEIEDAVTGKDFSKLNIMDIKQLLSMYVNEFLPWYNGWMKEFNEPFMPEDVTDNNEEE